MVLTFFRTFLPITVPFSSFCASVSWVSPMIFDRASFRVAPLPDPSGFR